MSTEELEKQLLRRIARLQEWYKTKAPKILIIKELRLIEESCEKLLENYSKIDK